MDAAQLSFGPFTLHAAAGLVRDGRPVPLGTRALALLTALAEAAGEAVTKERLLERGWPETVVEEGNLTVQVAALRKALGARRDGGEWIVTVPRVGYRLVIGARSTEPANGATELPVLAVLPFQNLGDDPAQDWFAEGIVAEIIGALARFRSFAVVSRNSSVAYKGRLIDIRQAATELGVRYLLEGSVRRSGDHLRITANLIDGQTGAHMWTERFDGSAGDVFAFQDRITERVATRVEPAIDAAEIARARRKHPDSLAAHDFYLQALALLQSESQADNAAAFGLLEKALKLEPENGEMLAKAAWALEHRNTMGWPPLTGDDVARCLELARLGLRHAGGNARAMGHCGMALFQTGREYALGLEVLRAATAANPNDGFVANEAGVATLHAGDLDEAVKLLERAWKLSGDTVLAHFSLSGLAHAAILNGQLEQALDLATRSLAINGYYDCTYWMLVAANAHLGRLDEARRHLGALLRLAPGVSIARIRAGQPAAKPERIEPILEGLRLAGMPEG